MIELPFFVMSLFASENEITTRTSEIIGNDIPMTSSTELLSIRVANF